MPLGYLERGKASGSTSLSHAAPGPARFWKRFILCKALPCLGVTHRALPAKLLRAEPMARRLLCHSLPSRGREARNRERARLSRLLPLKASHWLSLWIVHSSFAVRALCAHQRNRNASHRTKRFQKRRGHRPDVLKACENR